MKKIFIFLMGLSLALLTSPHEAFAAKCHIENGVRVCDGGGRPNPPPPTYPGRPNPPPPTYPGRPNPPPPTYPGRPNPPPPTYPGRPNPPPPTYPGRPNPPPQSRHCYVDSYGARTCYVEPGHAGGYHPVPPSRPSYPTPPYYPPNYRPPVCRPRPPVYTPPVYYPAPNYRPSWDYNRVQNLVYNLEYALSQTLWLAEDESNQTNSQQQSWAAFRLETLRDQIVRLRDDLSRYPYNPTYSASDYRSVKSAFEDARESMYWAYFSIQVDEQFDRVERAIFELDTLFWGY